MTNTKSIFSQFFFGGLLLLAIGLPLSIFLVSVSQFIIIGSWLLDGSLTTKLKTAFSNKSVLILISVYFLLVVGLVYTSDFEYAVKDLRIKLPLLLLPVLFASMPPLTANQFKLLFALFIVSVLISSSISTAIYAGFTHKFITDIRQISPFMSHIRLGMYVCIAVYGCIWFYKTSLVLWHRIIAGILFFWFLYFLLILESITGYSIMLFIGIIFCLAFVFRTDNKLLKLSTLTLLVAFFIFSYTYIHTIWIDLTTVKPGEANNQKTATTKGNAYTQDIKNINTENGYLVGINICETELRDEWNKKSKLNYDGKNLRGDELRFTIMRFLTSKGLTKDGAAVEQLTSEEIVAIEKGVANIDYMNSKSLRPRINVTLWELRQYQLFRNPDGHSIAMRLEFWRTAWLIIKDNFFLGVGTGDVPDAFAKKYTETNSPLSENYRLRAHNQYITMAIALGIPFLIWFIFTLIAPAFLQNKTSDYLYMAFLLTAIFAFLTEDTLETQAGLSFYAFFNSLFLFLKPEIKKR